MSARESLIWLKSFANRNTMKKQFFALLILIMVIALPTRSISQVWCPPGATWHYSNWLIGFEGYSKLTYSKDTLIKGISCKKITNYINGPFTQGNFSPYYTYSKNGIVYLYNDKYGINKFEILFDINAQIGDTWRMPQVDSACADSLFFITVLNTGSKTINGFNLKWLYVKKGPSPFNNFQYDTITERLGFRFDDIDYTSCHGGSVEVAGGPLRCYSDSTFGLYSTNTNKPCEINTAITESDLIREGLKIYPNPASEKLNIIFPFNVWEKTATFILYDLTGKVVLSNTLNRTADIEEISITDLSQGLYLYQIRIDNTQIKGKIGIVH